MLFDAAEAMSPHDRWAWQNAQLARTIDRLVAAEGVMATRLQEAGIGAGSGISLGDLARLPTTSRSDLEAAYPYGMLAVPREAVVAVHASSGTTGSRYLLAAYSYSDLQIWSDLCARALWAAGVRPGSTVHNAYGYGLFTGGLGIHQGAIRLGATVVPAANAPIERQVSLVVDLQPDLLACTPADAIRLGEALQSDHTARTLVAGLFGAEVWSEQTRHRIEGLFPGLRALDIYGLAEVLGPGVAFECGEGSGLHVNDDHFLVECLDPENAEPLPEGTVGELAFTTLTKEAMPLLRYRSGDLASLTSEPCGCGRTSIRMSRVLRRFRRP